MTTTRLFGLTAAWLLIAAGAGAQTPQTTTPSTSSQAPATASDASTRPATTTFFGDTGLWFVPTGEVLAHKKWSASVYRRGTNFVQGYSNVADFAGTFAVGVKDRAEIFGSFLVDTRIDRDVRPVFVPDPTFGSFLDRYPRVNQYWTGDNIGDFYVGAKYNLMSEFRQQPAALALRGMIKLATGDDAKGVSTGETDFSVDFIASKEAKKLVEVSGFGGYEWRGSPSDFDLPGGAFRWGAGVGFPSRNWLRVTGELNGLLNSDDTASTGQSLIGTDGSRSLLTANTDNITRATFGITAQTKSGVFFGAGVSWNVPTEARDLRFAEDGKDVWPL